ncbi:hypothetical protein CLOM_g24359 [Closterium sp. NIES-68]|nr:hypothetical protein CLOM_g24359 [Closterium sp. NIES-68]GJP72148.1 hypothetical protein CLOP_g2905 [Closterium sp. NIES-67]
MGGIVSRLRGLRLPSDPFNLAPGMDAILLDESDAFLAAATLTYYHFALPPHHLDAPPNAHPPHARSPSPSARAGASSGETGGGAPGGGASGEGGGRDRGSGSRGGSGGGGGGMVWRFQLVDAVQWLHQHVRDAAAAGDIPEDDPLLPFLRRFLPRSPPSRIDINLAFSLLSASQRQAASTRGLSLRLFHTVAAHSLRCAALRRLHTRLLLLVPCAATCSALASLALFGALGITRGRLERPEKPLCISHGAGTQSRAVGGIAGTGGNPKGSANGGTSSSSLPGVGTVQGDGGGRGWRWSGLWLLQPNPRPRPSTDAATTETAAAAAAKAQHRTYHTSAPSLNSAPPAILEISDTARVALAGGRGVEAGEALPRRVVVIPSLLLGAAIGAALALHL